MEARLDRPITLHLMGDWGIANLHRICGWVSAELWRRSPGGSKFARWAGRGGTDAITSVLDGDAGGRLLFVPAGFARTIFEGRGICARADVGRLRALGTLPQDDRLVFAIDARYGIHDFATLRAKCPPLRYSTAWDDGVNMTGFAAYRMLEALGIPPVTIEFWGGKLLLGEGPWDVIPRVTSGEADAVLFEAVMTPYWRDMCAARPVHFLPFEDAALDEVESKFAWCRRKLPPTGLLASARRSRRSIFRTFSSAAAMIFLTTLPTSSRRSCARRRRFWKVSTATSRPRTAPLPTR